MKNFTLLAFVILISVILLVKYGSRPHVYQPTDREKVLQADTARQGKVIQLLKLEVKSFHARALKAEEALIKPKAERKELKKELAQDKTVKDSVKTLVKLDVNADSVIVKQDTLISVLKKVDLFQDSIINHLEVKVKDVTQLDEIHLKELKKERRRSFWHQVKDIALPVLALLVGLLI
jgi:hypothetical protein